MQQNETPNQDTMTIHLERESEPFTTFHNVTGHNFHSHLPPDAFFYTINQDLGDGVTSTTFIQKFDVVGVVVTQGLQE